MTARAHVSRGRALAMLHHYDEAIETLREAVLGYENVFGTENNDTYSARAVLGDVLIDAGYYAEAEALFLRLADQQRRVVGPGVSLSYLLAQLGEATLRQGKFAEATAYYESAIEMGTPVLPPDHPSLYDWAQQLTNARNGVIMTD